MPLGWRLTDSQMQFAIQTTIRNHDKALSRGQIIEQIANLVGKGHPVDLKGYEALILVEVYKASLTIARKAL